MSFVHPLSVQRNREKMEKSKMGCCVIPIPAENISLSLKLTFQVSKRALPHPNLSMHTAHSSMRIAAHITQGVHAMLCVALFSNAQATLSCSFPPLTHYDACYTSMRTPLTHIPSSIRTKVRATHHAYTPAHILLVFRTNVHTYVRITTPSGHASSNTGLHANMPIAP